MVLSQYPRICLAWSVGTDMTRPSAVVKPRDLVAWKECLTPIPFEKLWRMDIVEEIRVAAKAANQPVNRSLLAKAKSLFPGVPIPVLPPSPTRPAPFNLETIIWDIPYDPNAPYNRTPWFTNNAEGRLSFTNQHRQYAAKAKESSNLKAVRTKVLSVSSIMIE